MTGLFVWRGGDLMVRIAAVMLFILALVPVLPLNRAIDRGAAHPGETKHAGN